MRVLPVPFERTFPYPPDVLYPWLTDLDDQDEDRAGDLIDERNILETHEDGVTYEQRVTVFGKERWNRVRVKLDPPDRWTAQDTRDRNGRAITRYHVTPTEDGGTRLRIDYNFAVPDLMGLVGPVLRPFLKRRLHRMWDGYEDAMRAELGGGVPE